MISFASGFLQTRLAVNDASSGAEQVSAGVFYRCRASEVISYEAEVPGVIVLRIRGMEIMEVAVVGTIDEMDKAMQRAFVLEVQGSMNDGEA